MTRTEEIKFRVTELEHDLNERQRIIDKAVGANEKIMVRFGYKSFLRYYNRNYLEEQIEWYFYDNAEDDCEVEVRFENDICYVEIK